MPRVIVKNIAGETYLYLEFTRAAGQRTAAFSSQSSRDLATWSDNPTGEETLNPDGTITTLFKDPEPIDATNGRTGFLRLYISD